MDTQTIIAMFDVYTGRSDLSETAKLWFINEGSMALDRLGHFPHQQARFMQKVEEGDYNITLPYQVRVVKYAYLRVPKGDSITGGTNDGTRKQLEAKSATDIAAMYADLSDSSTYGVPACWAISYRPLTLPNAGVEALDLPADLADAAADSTVADHINLVIAPAPSQTYYLELYVCRYSPLLKSDSDSNWWSTNYGHLLLQAAQAVYQESLLNFVTADKLRAAVQFRIQEYFHDQVEQEQAGVPPVMEY